MKTTNTAYSQLARFFHWCVAGLIVTQYVLAQLADNAKLQDRLLEQLALLANHKSIGITILVLAILRLGYRLFNRAPELPNSMPHWQKVASNISHIALYALLFAMPISGWLMSSAKAYSVSWFNLFALPDFVAPNESLADILVLIHSNLGIALFIVAVLHIAAALKHHFIDRDQVLNRMAGVGSWLVFIVVILVTLLAFGRFFDQAKSESAVASGSTGAKQVIVMSDLPLWEIDYDKSYIKFTGDQAGAAFTGEWQAWSADIQFDSQQLEESRFNVSIEADSADSNDQDRDETIRSSEFFDVTQFSQAKYLAQTFVQDGGQFTSKGQLLMKGASSGLDLNFTVVEQGQERVLKGSASIDRLLWNIGAGDWQDTSWVGQLVTVEVLVTATTNPED